MKPTKERSRIQDEMAFHRIFVTDIAKKLNRHRVTIHLWLKDLNEERYALIMRAIEEIAEERKG
jgi:transposase